MTASHPAPTSAMSAGGASVEGPEREPSYSLQSPTSGAILLEEVVPPR